MHKDFCLAVVAVKLASASASDLPVHEWQLHSVGDCRGHIFATVQVNPQGLDGTNRSPRNPPPAHKERQQAPGHAFPDAAFLRRNEVYVRALHYGHHNGGKTVAVNDELPAPVQLEADFLRCHACDTFDVRHETSHEENQKETGNNNLLSGVEDKEMVEIRKLLVPLVKSGSLVSCAIPLMNGRGATLGRIPWRRYEPPPNRLTREKNHHGAGDH